MNFKRMIVVALALMLTAVPLSACSNTGTTEQNTKTVESSSSEKKMRTVTDMAGNQVEVPEQIESVVITSWGQPFGIMLSLGKVDLVKGMSDSKRYPWIQHQFPQFKAEIPNYGSFDEVNVEELANAKPDIIFVPAKSEQTNAKMRELGLPVYVTKVEDTNEYYEKELMELAALFHETEKAEALIKHNHDLKAEIAKRVEDIPESEKKTAYIMRRTILEKHSDEWGSGQAVVAAGGINVAGDTDKGFETTTEALLGWNPEYIFQVISVENNAQYYNELKNDPVFQDIKAIQTGDTYTFPLGINYWYEGADSGLGVLMIAKVLYPERFEDMNLRAHANKFYKEYMGIDLDDEGYDIMLRGFDGAKSIKGM